MDDALLRTFVDELRGRLGPTDEGTIWALYVDAHDRSLLATQVDAAGRSHSGAERLTEVAYLLGNAGAHGVVVAVPRRDGQPTPADREFLRRLRVLMVCEPTELRDLLIIGADSFWSAQQDDQRGAVA
jgi:DNA repair protein RadC